MSRGLAILLIGLATARFYCARADHVAYGEHGAVATVHPLATDAALATLQRGGNAIDATVAAALTLGVVDGYNSGLGGGCFILIRTAKGELVAIDGRETAPGKATRDMYLREGKADTKLSQTGPLAVGVPGALAAYADAVTNYGKLKLSELLLPAARLAEEGFVLNAGYASRIAGTADELRPFEGARAIFLNAEAKPWEKGATLKQVDLAGSYRNIAEHGCAWFYEGAFAATVARWMSEHGGLITEEDFRNYRARRREPLVTRYRGVEIVGFPPPSSGGVHVAQILNTLEHFDLAGQGPDSPDFVHLVAESMKLAFADRAFWLGDPDFAKVPRGLAEKSYATRLARRIDSRKASGILEHDTPGDATESVFGKHTTHFSVADAEGNWVACTATINTSFGSKIVVPGTGIVLNNEMDDFSVQPGVTNYFGLVGAEANAVAPGKRPLSSMSPTLVLREGKPILSVGAAGGPTIISQTVLALIRILDFKQNLGDALAAPRFHHQWKPDELKVETRLGAAIIAELEKRGHTVKKANELGVTQAVGLDADRRRLVGAHDPRVAGKAGAY